MNINGNIARRLLRDYRPKQLGNLNKIYSFKFVTRIIILCQFLSNFECFNYIVYDCFFFLFSYSFLLMCFMMTLYN